LTFLGWNSCEQFGARYRQDCGITACQVLEQRAAPLIPDLIKLLNRRPSAAIAEALARTGLDVIPALIGSLSDWNDEVRVWAQFAVGTAAALAKRDSCHEQPGIDFGPVVVALAQNLEDDSDRVRKTAVWALGQLASHAESTVPALAQAFCEPDLSVQTAAENAPRPVAQDASQGKF